MSGFGRLMRAETRIDFAGKWRRWFAISGTVILIGLISLGVRGLNFSIDFKGGTIWQVPTSASVTAVRDAVASVDSTVASQAEIEVQTSRSTHQRIVQVQAGTEATGNQTLIDNIKVKLAELAGTNERDVNVESVGASWGSQITNKAIEAVIIFLIAVGIYIWLRFEGKMAVAALVALAHDMLVTVGIYSLSGFQVSPDTVVAFLTILGYSLYDTIVVFDKVQENTKSLASSNRQTYTDMVNLSMNQVLARSINTSLVAIIPILSILVIGAGLLGASTLADFGLALVIGLTTGAYSSIFIASPLVALLKEREPRYKEIRRRIANMPPASAKAATPSKAAASKRPAARAGAASAGSEGPAREGGVAGGAPTAVVNVRGERPSPPSPTGSGSAARPESSGRTGSSEGRAGSSAGRTGSSDRRTGSSEGRGGSSERRAGSSAGRPADDDSAPATPTPPRPVNRPPPRPRKKTRRR